MLKINKEKIIEMIPMMILLIITMVMISILVVFSYNWYQFSEELIQVDGEVLEKYRTGPNHIFIVKEDDGHIIKFTVEFEEYYTYDVGSYYSGEIRRGNFVEGP